MRPRVCGNTPRPSQFQLPAPASAVLTVDRPVSGQWFELDGGKRAVEFRKVGGKRV